MESESIQEDAGSKDKYPQSLFPLASERSHQNWVKLNQTLAVNLRETPSPSPLIYESAQLG